MLDIREPEEQALADGIISVLIKHHPVMEWSDVVYSDWNADGSISFHHIPGGDHRYSGTPLARNNYTQDKERTNHFHIDWVDFGLKNPQPAVPRRSVSGSPAARKTGFTGAIQPDLEAIKRGATPSWLWGWWKITKDGDDSFYYFELAGFAAWTDEKPSGGRAPIVHPQNKGGTRTSPGVRWPGAHEGAFHGERIKATDDRHFEPLRAADRGEEIVVPPRHDFSRSSNPFRSAEAID